MKKLSFSLRADHVSYVAEYMSTQAANVYFSTTSDLAALFKANDYQPGDIVTVNIDPDGLLQVHAALGGRPEFQTAKIHGDIQDALLPQLAAIAHGADADAAASAMYVINELTNRRAQADQSVQDKINTGKNFLKS